MKTTATWNGVTIAESNECIAVESNAYFPRASLKTEFIKPSTHTSFCPWKGTANYMSLEVNGQQNENAVWVYEAPLPAAKPIAGYVAFWKGVKVTGGEHAVPMVR
ncbi:MAG: DUF427 domain-containing protein [Notoacmeibacter sp.]